MKKLLLTICLVLIAVSGFCAYPNYHFKDSTPPYWRIEGGVWKYQSVSTGWTDTNETLEAVWYMDDAQMQYAIADWNGSLTSTFMPVAGATDVKSPRFSGLGDGFHFQPGAGSTYLSATNVQLSAATTNMTIGCWIPDGNGAAYLDVGQLGSDIGSLASFNSSGNFGYFVDGSQILPASTPVPTNSFFNVLTMDGTNMIHYLDGQPVYTNAYTAPFDASTDHFNIGVYYNSSLLANCNIDKPFMLKDRGLTPQEVSDLYDLGSTNFNFDGIGDTGLVAYYPMTNTYFRVNCPLASGVYGETYGLFPQPTYANTATMRIPIGTNINGRVNYGALFDDTDDNLIADDTVFPNPPNTSDFIVTQWIKFNSLGTDGLAGWAINVGGQSCGTFSVGASIYFRWVGDASQYDIIANTPVVTNAWTLISFIHSSTGVSKLFIDDVQQSTTYTNTGALNLGVADFMVGVGTSVGTPDATIGTMRYYLGTTDTNIIIDVINNTEPTSGDIEIRKVQE